MLKFIGNFEELRKFGYKKPDAEWYFGKNYYFKDFVEYNGKYYDIQIKDSSIKIERLLKEIYQTKEIKQTNKIFKVLIAELIQNKLVVKCDGEILKSLKSKGEGNE